MKVVHRVGKSRLAGYAVRLLAIGYWLLAIGYWLLAIGYWFLHSLSPISPGGVIGVCDRALGWKARAYSR
ncbi:MAG: hypothetical protein BWK72_04565 [Rhodoferax ferrireducens]|uniref:Uncharacterized protein n=1 Tax=Rhodoferax ferrireducens TaxID=192843 RepID=A0A1W9KX74_9BURK|nr:MAG: hypothetical protein BWK72_04565 [Rhodoferax ferrireducens]